MAKSGKHHKKSDTPTIENRRARHDYFISDTLEVGIRLVGTEVKAVRDGKASLKEGYVSVENGQLTLHNVNIGEYPPAGQLQHAMVRRRRLLAHRREIKRLARQVEQRGVQVGDLHRPRRCAVRLPRLVPGHGRSRREVQLGAMGHQSAGHGRAGELDHGRGHGGPGGGAPRGGDRGAPRLIATGARRG